MTTDKNQYFIQSLLDGDSKGIAQIYKVVFPKVLHFVLNNKGQYADAEDVFQRVLLQLGVRIKKREFKISSTFEGYMFTACKNLWRRELNRTKKWVTKEGELELITEERELALELLNQERWELYRDSFKKLSVNCREILNFFFNKKTYKEIVEQTAYTSETVVRQRVFKCKSKLTALVKNDCRFKILR